MIGHTINNITKHLNKNNKNRHKNSARKEEMPPMKIQQPSPSDMVAASIVHQSVDVILTCIANVLNGLLNGNPSTLEQTSISLEDAVSVGHFADKQLMNVWTIA